VQSTDEEVQK